MKFRSLKFFPALGILAVGGLLLWAQPVLAVDSGPTTTGDVCMQQIFGGSTVTPSNRLNCTANDISIARAISATNLDTGTSSCFSGTTFTLQATFQVNVTANERYDAAFFFNIAGGADARNPNGTCSESILTKTIDPAQDLDGDFCGDLNAGTYNTITFTIPGVQCVDTDNDGTLNLPNCTSWHSNQDTVCTGFSSAGPETKSKCNCDDTFQVPITVESPSGAVFKTATEALVTYEVTVKNNSTTIDVTLQSLTDSHYGVITSPHAEGGGFAAVDSTDCATGGTIAKNGGTYTCHFKAKYLNPGSDGPVANTVTATLRDPAHPENDHDENGSTTIDIDLGTDHRP